MNFIGIIPARYQSTRFPGKPLFVINGKTMIQRVYEQALKSKVLKRVIVATDDKSIENHVKMFGGEVMMTSKKHKSGTDRCNEVIENLKNIEKDFVFDVAINIQGDEPYIDPLQIELLASCFKNKEVEIATLLKKIDSEQELFDQNVVKCAPNINKSALYFSRASIPFIRDKEKGKWLESQDFYKHIGIYAYRIDVLQKITKLKKSKLETAESLEQLRWLENGYKINVEFTEIESVSIDTINDILKLKV
ncbi:MAG: 3-deoxy-manno-octulosonate cytidylyltransferase [Bacteroidetes bacterium]|nr:3-deoxy-manno-octulosonate cytidylyltransferase [Bacteroidota bacterium]